MASENAKTSNPLFWAQTPDAFKLRVKHVSTYWDAQVGAWASVYSHGAADCVLETEVVTYITFTKPNDDQLKIIWELAVMAFWLMTDPDSARYPVGRV